MCFGQQLLAVDTNRFSLKQILSRWQPLPLKEVAIAAESGDLTAQHYLGYYYCEGMSGATNLTEGLRWYRLAADKNFPNSQNNLGVLYSRGSGVPLDDVVACQWFEKAAQQGFPGALGNLAEMMRKKRYPLLKSDELRKLHEQAAAAGDPEAQIQLGHFLVNPPGGGTLEIQNAIYWYKKAFSQGRKDACYHIGRILMFTGDTKVIERAVLWYQRGADLGDESCKAALGWAAFTGRGVKQDPEKGLRIALELAEGGHVGMMYNLGCYYADEGLPVRSPIPKDLPKAVMWYRKAAEKGYAPAMEMLGQHMLENPASGEQEMEGLKWLQKAVELGSYQAKTKLASWAEIRPELVPGGLEIIEEEALRGKAEFMLSMAKRYQTGKGVKQDDLLASFWMLEGSRRWYGNPWGGVAALDSEGKLMAGANEANRRFAQLYISYIQARREQKADFFSQAAAVYEQGNAVQAANRLFAFLCYWQAGKFGDANAKTKAEELQLTLDKKDFRRAEVWMKLWSDQAQRMEGMK